MAKNVNLFQSRLCTGRQLIPKANLEDETRTKFQRLFQFDVAVKNINDENFLKKWKHI